MYYKLTNVVIPHIFAFWKDSDFIKFIKIMNKKLLKIKILISKIENTTSLKLGKKLYDVDLQSV
jgi:hypothetical protein